jgi:TPR repeat protein
MYANGQGVPQDYAEAVKWFRKAAEQGNAMAQYNLGIAYANGQGVSRDDTGVAPLFFALLRNLRRDPHRQHSRSPLDIERDGQPQP